MLDLGSQNSNTFPDRPAPLSSCTATAISRARNAAYIRAKVRVFPLRLR